MAKRTITQFHHTYDEATRAAQALKAAACRTDKHFRPGSLTHAPPPFGPRVGRGGGALTSARPASFR